MDSYHMPTSNACMRHMAGIMHHAFTPPAMPAWTPWPQRSCTGSACKGLVHSMILRYNSTSLKHASPTVLSGRAFGSLRTPSSKLGSQTRPMLPRSKRTSSVLMAVETGVQQG
eukprot:353615-Chlamydomonas_euryale.AAC.3